MKQILVFLIAISFLRCNNDEKPPIKPDDVIIEATNLIYTDLNDLEKEDMIFTRCCCYPHNWNQGVNCIEKEDAFYVKAKIDINLLGLLSESRTFNKSSLINSNPHSLYGKYHNRWKFLDKNGVEICETSKFEGHHDFRLIRNDSIDEIIIGPLPVKPNTMIIEIIDSKYYDGIIPKVEIKTNTNN